MADVTNNPGNKQTTVTTTKNGTIVTKVVRTQVKDGKIVADESEQDGVRQ